MQLCTVQATMLASKQLTTVARRVTKVHRKIPTRLRQLVLFVWILVTVCMHGKATTLCF